MKSLRCVRTFTASQFYRPGMSIGKTDQNTLVIVIIESNGLKKDLTKLIEPQSQAHKSAFLFLKDFKNGIYFDI